MFKFLVFGVILSQTVVKNGFGQTSLSPYDSQPDIMIEPYASTENDSSDAMLLQKAGLYPFYLSRLNLYFGDSRKYQKVDTKLDADYFVSDGVGAHKLHLRKLSWSQARRICIDEGGHLAVIRTDAEEKILLGMMMKNSVTRAWVGYHDITKENSWFSVMDEPIGKIGWARWSTSWSPNPNPNDGRCAELIDDGGLTNLSCYEEKSFICKISLD